jgi:hypothetical protein
MQTGEKDPGVVHKKQGRDTLCPMYILFFRYNFIILLTAGKNVVLKNAATRFILMCNRCPAAPASRYRHIAEGGHPGLPSFAGTPWQAKVTGVCIFNNGSR